MLHITWRNVTSEDTVYICGAIPATFKYQRDCSYCSDAPKSGQLLHWEDIAESTVVDGSASGKLLVKRRVQIGLRRSALARRPKHFAWMTNTAHWTAAKVFQQITAYEARARRRYRQISKTRDRWSDPNLKSRFANSQGYLRYFL